MSRLVVVVVALSLSLVACADEEEHGRVRVEPIKAACYGVWRPGCLLVTDLDDPAAQTTVWQSGIDGLDSDYRWGTTYEVDITIHRDDDPPPDAPAVTWSADDIRVVATAPAGTPFTLPYRANSDRWFFRQDGEIRTLGAVVHCADPAVCDQAFDLYLTSVEAAFTHDGQGGLELVSLTPTP